MSPKIDFDRSDEEWALARSGEEEAISGPWIPPKDEWTDAEVLEALVVAVDRFLEVLDLLGSSEPPTLRVSRQTFAAIDRLGATSLFSVPEPGESVVMIHGVFIEPYDKS